MYLFRMNIIHIAIDMNQDAMDHLCYLEYVILIGIEQMHGLLICFQIASG